MLEQVVLLRDQLAKGGDMVGVVPHDVVVRRILEQPRDGRQRVFWKGKDLQGYGEQMITDA